MSDEPFYLAWLLLHDEEFARDIAPTLDVEDYPQGALRGLTMLAKDQVTRYRKPTTLQVLEQAFADGWDPERYGTDRDAILDVYHRLDDFAIEDEAYDRISDACIRWLTARHIGRSLDTAGKELDRGRIEEAAQALDRARHEYSRPEPPLTLSDVSLLFQEQTNGALPTGIPFIDRNWKGGVRPHELAVFISGTNLGKSMFLCWLAVQCYLSNHSCVYYTSELTPKQILGRIAAGLLKRSLDDISESEAISMIPYLTKQKGITAHLSIRELRNPMTVRDLRLDIEEQRRQGQKPDMVLLDSADDLFPEREGTQDWLNQAEVYGALRRYAVQDGVMIWSSTQANRDVIDKARISLKHMGRSFAKAQRAHFVIGLAQTDSQREDPMGPLVGMFILKDSQWGSPGQWQELKAHFGRGAGYPGFSEVG